MRGRLRRTVGRPVTRREAERTACGLGGGAALPLLKDEAFAAGLREVLEGFRNELRKELAGNPFGVPWHPQIWGIGWNIQELAVGQYYLSCAFPNMFDGQEVCRVNVHRPGFWQWDVGLRSGHSVLHIALDSLLGEPAKVTLDNGFEIMTLRHTIRWTSTGVNCPPNSLSLESALQFAILSQKGFDLFV